MGKRVNFLDGALVSVMAAMLLTVGVGFFLLPHRSFSERENRRLTTWERPSWQTVADGSFSEHLGRLYRDQLPGRERWIAWKAGSERLLGKRENNGILFGEDGYLMARNEYRELSVAKENLAAVAELSDAVTVWIPRSADVMTEALPHAYPNDAAKELYALLEGRGILPRQALQAAAEEGKQVYYRTDHHLTAEGAYLVYCMLGESLGYLPVAREEFSEQTVSEHFLGSADSAVGGIADQADCVTLFRYEGDEDLTVTDRTTGEVRGCYDWSALEGKDQYAVFLGGNFAHLLVENVEDEKNGKPRLLLVKDSFANALVPLLAIHFDLEIVDLRYVGDTVSVEAYDQLLILQGVDTLATDPSLKKIGWIEVG